MSVSAELKASARSAYRNLYRASSAIFGGDAPVLAAFRTKMREDALATRSEMSPSAYEKYATHAREIAQFLRRNVVQATKSPEDGIWSIRITKDTELGDNESIKGPLLSSSQRATQLRHFLHTNLHLAMLCLRCSAENAAPARDTTPLIRPMYYSALKRASRQRKIPELKEEDIEESFVRGSGPGGQSVNKTENNVQLLHKPTGLRVSCQETRSLFTNRMLARRLLTAKLDALENPGLSNEDVKRAKQRERERRRRKKAKKKMERKQAESHK